MSYNDTILGGEGRKSRMEQIVRNIRVGTDNQLIQYLVAKIAEVPLN